MGEPLSALDSRDNVTTPLPESGTSCLHPRQSEHHPAILSPPVLARLITRERSPHELPSLIGEIFACKDVDDMVRHLPADDAQTFIDVLDEVHHTSARRC
jgi:hypothetical protein